MEDGLVLGPGADGCRRHLDDDDDDDDDDDPHRALVAPVRVRLVVWLPHFRVLSSSLFSSKSTLHLLNPPHGKHHHPTRNRAWLLGPNVTPPKLLWLLHSGEHGPLKTPS